MEAVTGRFGASKVENQWIKIWDQGSTGSKNWEVRLRDRNHENTMKCMEMISKSSNKHAIEN